MADPAMTAREAAAALPVTPAILLSVLPRLEPDWKRLFDERAGEFAIAADTLHRPASDLVALLSCINADQADGLTEIVEAAEAFARFLHSAMRLASLRLDLARAIAAAEGRANA